MKQQQQQLEISVQKYNCDATHRKGTRPNKQQGGEIIKVLSYWDWRIRLFARYLLSIIRFYLLRHVLSSEWTNDSSVEDKWMIHPNTFDNYNEILLRFFPSQLHFKVCLSLYTPNRMNLNERPWSTWPPWLHSLIQPAVSTGFFRRNYWLTSSKMIPIASVCACVCERVWCCSIKLSARIIPANTSAYNASVICTRCDTRKCHTNCFVFSVPFPSLRFVIEKRVNRNTHMPYPTHTHARTTHTLYTSRPLIAC